MVEQHPHRLRLEIEPVRRRAEQIVSVVERDLSSHQGLLRASRGVVSAAESAQWASHTLQRPWGPHRIPAAFLAIALLVFAYWIYWRFWRVTDLTIALPERDAIMLHAQVSSPHRVRLQEIKTVGSRQSARMVSAGEVDLAFIQGGIEIEPHLLRLKSSSPELVLFFLREGVSVPSQMRLVLTSVENQGSHSVARHFMDAWGVSHRVRYLHDWRTMTTDPNYRIPDNVDAVFVVKDPSNEKALAAMTRLADAGFRLVPPHLGARALRYSYLTPQEIPAGYLRADPRFPGESISSYNVATYLVAREGLTPRLLAEAARVLRTTSHSIADQSFEPTIGDTSDAIQGVDAFLGIVVYIGLAFLTLLGLGGLTYRRRFNELNSLVSLISMHQSDKDVLGLTDAAKRAEHLHYLSLCSDLLGLISAVAGYYSQENVSLWHNNLLQTIHERCSGLKINIQLKILHSEINVRLPEESLPEEPRPETTPADGG